MTDRYSRQTFFPGIGKEGQRKLGNSYVVIIGCGALGTIIATSLVRAGVGKVRIVDRDFIEYRNLEHHLIFDEDDIENQLPKAIAAEHHLKKGNTSVEVEGVVADANYTNIEKLISGADLILDGTDNDDSHFLINDVALKNKVPWIHGTAIASRGMTMTVIPRESPCYRCVFASPLTHGSLYTSTTSGIISPASLVIGSFVSVEAMKILVEDKLINLDQIVIDTWKGTFHRLKIKHRVTCPACQGKYEFLEGKFWVKATTVCGEDAVQVLDPTASNISLQKMATRLVSIGQVTHNEFMLRLSVDSWQIVLFPDGRAIVKNTNDEHLAKELYDEYIGSRIKHDLSR